MGLLLAEQLGLFLGVMGQNLVPRRGTRGLSLGGLELVGQGQKRRELAIDQGLELRPAVLGRGRPGLGRLLPEPLRDHVDIV
jgi:hypothetical protein